MAGETLDRLDIAIMAELQEDGRRSYREIAKRLGTSAVTIRSRFMQLARDGVVEVIAVPNPWRMGFQFFAAVGLRIAPDGLEESAEILVARQDVSYVSVMATGYDMLIEVALRDVQEFRAFKRDVLWELPGFISFEVHLLSDVRKLHYRLA